MAGISRQDQQELKAALKRKRKNKDGDDGDDGRDSDAGEEAGSGGSESTQEEKKKSSKKEGKPKAKPKGKARAKASAKSKGTPAEGRSRKKETSNKVEKTKKKATFARRYMPQGKDGAKWWTALSEAFEEIVKDEVKKPSSHEDTGWKDKREDETKCVC